MRFQDGISEGVLHPLLGEKKRCPQNFLSIKSGFLDQPREGGGGGKRGSVRIFPDNSTISPFLNPVRGVGWGLATQILWTENCVDMSIFAEVHT